MSRFLALAGTALAALLTAVPAAAAAPCPPQPAKQAFAPFLDPAYYTLAPGGAFEDAASSWSLDGAAVVAGNEPFYLNAPGDGQALAIPGGGVATSPAMCVSLDHPTMRFMVRSTGSPAGILAVYAVVREGQGVLDSVPMGIVRGNGSAWRPSSQMLLANGLIASLLNGSALVSFRFEVLGSAASFVVDDVYVDPYQRG